MTQVKINDLSVGDWVQDKNGIIAQIRGVECWSDGYVINVQTKAGTITNLTEAGVCPIPITPEILEKNGFEENCGRWYNSEALMEFEQYKDGWCRTVNCGEYSVYFIKYVHQLQHAMRLASVEKEIEL